MTLNEYQQQAMATCLESCRNDTYMLFGLMAEVGEVADKIAKWKRKRMARMDWDTLVFSTGDVEEAEQYKRQLLAEIGDCLWFLAGVSDVMGMKLEDVAQMNLDKLSSRQQRGVIDGNGDNR